MITDVNALRLLKQYTEKWRFYGIQSFQIPYTKSSQLSENIIYPVFLYPLNPLDCPLSQEMKQRWYHTAGVIA